MPNLSDHHSSQLTKLLYIGDSSAGKTGSLASLVAAGYRIRILDMDNGVDALKFYVNETCPDKITQVDYETRRDKYKATAQGPLCNAPKAFAESLKLLEKWTDETDPSTWGPQTIFVLDSLSSFGKAAFEWARGMNPGAKDPRQWYFSAQQAVENTIALLTGEAFHTNVIIISHINWKEMQDGQTKGYANAIGSALGPTLARYFNTLILAESSGSGKSVRRKIKTMPTGAIDLKTPTPRIEQELPLETGLATIFSKLKETK